MVQIIISFILGIAVADAYWIETIEKANKETDGKLKKFLEKILDK